jgi:hypothetical protein
MFVYLPPDPNPVPVRVVAEFALGTLVAEITDYTPGRNRELARAGNDG